MPKEKAPWNIWCCNPFGLKKHSSKVGKRKVTVDMCNKIPHLVLGESLCHGCRLKIARINNHDSGNGPETEIQRSATEEEGMYTKVGRAALCEEEYAPESTEENGDLDLSDSGAPSVEDNEASDGAGPAEGNDEGSSFSREDFEMCDVSDVKVKVEQSDDFCSEPETKRPRVQEYQEESKMEEALTILKDLKQNYSASQGPNDKFTLYGQHVASKLRGYSEKTSAIVEHAINNILFEADMGNYDGIHTALPSHDDTAQ